MMNRKETVCIASGMVNEEKALPRFLKASTWANEVIMCDAGCTDRSVEICEEFGVKVFKMPFDGNHNTRCNYQLSLIDSDWIFCIDPDEVMTDELKSEISNVLMHGSENAAFEFTRVNFFMNKPLRHGGWSGKSLRMYRKDKVSFNGDAYHDHPVIDGSIGQLKGEVWHYPSPNIHWVLQKFNYISEFDCKAYFDQYGVMSHRKFCWMIFYKPFRNGGKALFGKKAIKMVFRELSMQR